MAKTYKLIKVENGFLDIMLEGSIEAVNERLMKAIAYWNKANDIRMIFNDPVTIITFLDTNETLVYYIGEVEPEPDLD